MQNEIPGFYYFYLRYKNGPRKGKNYFKLAVTPEYKRY